jgi:precorrin-6B methylase 2
MPELPKKPVPPRPVAPSGGAAAIERAERRAKALRENLLRRKAQDRARSEGEADHTRSDGEKPDSKR